MYYWGNSATLTYLVSGKEPREPPFPRLERQTSCFDTSAWRHVVTAPLALVGLDATDSRRATVRYPNLNRDEPVGIESVGQRSIYNGRREGWQNMRHRIIAQGGTYSFKTLYPARGRGTGVLDLGPINLLFFP